MSKVWEVQPGRGGHILAQLGEDVQWRARLGPPTPQLRAEAALGEEAAYAIITRGVNTLAAGDTAITPNQLLGTLMAAEQRSLAATRIGGSLLDAVERFERKSYLEPDPYERRTHLRISITPLVEDAVFWRVDSGWPSTRERETRMLQAGETREGDFAWQGSLISAPTVGGQLTMMSGGNFLTRNFVTVTGLVSPETGEPQVDLEVLAR